MRWWIHATVITPCPWSRRLIQHMDEAAPGHTYAIEIDTNKLILENTNIKKIKYNFLRN